MAKDSKITLRKILFAVLIFILFLMFGLFYTFVSYDTLVQLNINLGLSEAWTHALGIGLIAIGVILFIFTLLTNLLKKIRHYGRTYWYAFIIFDILKWMLIVGLGYLVIRGGIGVTQSAVG